MNALWLKTVPIVRWLSLSVLLQALAIFPAQSAERITLSYGILQRSISVDSLETYVRTGQVNDDLEAYVQDTDPNQVAQLRRVLQNPIPLSAVEVSQFLYTSIGESLLERLSGIIPLFSNLRC